MRAVVVGFEWRRRGRLLAQSERAQSGEGNLLGRTAVAALIDQFEGQKEACGALRVSDTRSAPLRARPAAGTLLELALAPPVASRWPPWRSGRSISGRAGAKPGPVRCDLAGAN
jgi:hypothetical protein